MSDTDFSVDSNSSSWDYDEVIKPPKWILPVGIASVSLGAIWSVVCLLDVENLLNIDSFKPGFYAGVFGYLLTLTVPSLLIVGLRRFKMKTSKESPGSYDSYAGAQVENRLKYLAISGLMFSLVAIYVAVLPLAERLAD